MLIYYHSVLLWSRVGVAGEIGRLEHAWVLCKPSSAFGTDEAGMEIRADHRWSKLARTSDGHFTRMSGWGNEGTWQPIDTYTMNGDSSWRWQVSFSIDGNGGATTAPQFAVSVPKMRLDNNAVYIADYVATADGRVTG